MLTTQTWVVCEKSGRWTAALRTAFARQRDVESQPRLHEVRTLEELSTHLNEHKCNLMLIEVGGENLTPVLQILVRRGRRPANFVALLEGDADQTRRLQLADLLWEAGALEVVESPRQLRGLLALHGRLLADRGPLNFGTDESQSFTDWAWSILPWQDA